MSTDEEKVRQLGRRDIVIAWRGTIRSSEWAANFKRGLSPAAMDKRPGHEKGPKIQVETGFLALYTSKNPKTRYNKTSARTQVLSKPPLIPHFHARVAAKSLNRKLSDRQSRNPL